MAENETVQPGPQIPADYEELKKYRESVAPFVDAVSPYVDDIRPLIEDEDTREYIREALRTREAIKKTREPQLDPALATEINRVREEFRPVVSYIEEEKQAKQAAKRAAEEGAQRANMEYAQRLLAERPDLGEDNYARLGMVAAYAASRGMSLEDAWKVRGSDFARPVPVRETPPKSLRGEIATPGVPGESAPERITGPASLRKRLIANMAAGGLKG